jgi:hypothetical protein
MPFVVAIVFAAKIKGIVPLTVSDKRILTVADYMNVDLSRFEAQTLPLSEPGFVVPAVLHESPAGGKEPRGAAGLVDEERDT